MLVSRHSGLGDWSHLFTASSALSKAARTYNVCGSVPAGQNPSIGTYSDTVLATVNF